MENDVFADESVAPKPKPALVKKSLFTKKAIARAAETDDSVAFFSRSRELWPQQLEEQERRRKKKETKLERKRTSESVEVKDAASPQEGKRRCVSGKQDAIALDSDDEVAVVSEVADRTCGDTSHSTPSKHKSRRTSHNSQASPNSLSERYSRDLRAQKRSELVKVNKGYISLSEDDDDDLAVRQMSEEPIVLDDGEDVYIVEEPRSRQPLRKTNDDNDLSDEEFPELVAMARERERQKALAKEKASKAAAASDDIFELEPAVEDDPTIEIFITSEIEETKSLLVRRKLSQQLRQVRQIWCDKQSIHGQPMSRDVKDAIFLTWKGKRLFDYTTCRALGLNVNASGRLDGDGVDENGRVHLEAWTEELFDMHQKMMAAQEQKANAEYDDDEEVEEQPKEVRLRLIFKSRDYGEFKLQAKPTTVVQKMIEAFRKAKAVPEDKAISFHVDGDKLDEDTQLADTELEDMDAVEVHIR